MCGRLAQAEYNRRCSRRRHRVRPRSQRPSIPEPPVSTIRALSTSTRGPHKPVGVVFAAFATAACVSTEVPHRRVASGEQIYLQVCVACHATGVENAPRLGDRAAWKPLIEEGQDTLTAHAWVGVRGMPARGGQPDLSLEEFGRATAYMVRAAGGDWKDPDAHVLHEIEEEIEDRLESLREGKEAKK